jgi:hypothetical protein
MYWGVRHVLVLTDRPNDMIDRWSGANRSAVPGDDTPPRHQAVTGTSRSG